MGRGIAGRVREHLRRSVPGGEDLGRHRRAQRRGRPLLLFVCGTLMLGGLLFLPLALGERQGFDRRALELIGEIRSPALYRAMVAVSWFGWQPQVALLTVPLVMLLFARGLIPEGAALLLALLAGTPVYLLLAILGDRRRPYTVVEELRVYRELTGVSFPSGHVINYVLFCGFLAYLTHTLIDRRPLRLALLAPSLALVALVGPSRVYLGQHWPSDVLASYLIGGALLLALLALYRRAKGRQLALAARREEQGARAPGDGRR